MMTMQFDALPDSKFNNCFSTLTPQRKTTIQSDFNSMFDFCKKQEYKLNEEICNAFQSRYYVYYIHSGTVKTTVLQNGAKKEISYYHGQGDFINLEVLQAKNYTLNSISKSKQTVVFQLRKEEFSELLQSNPSLQAQFYKQLLTERNDLEKRFLTLWQKSSSERICGFIYQYACRFGKKVGFEILIKGALTHQEIANHVCASRQTVTTVMNELRNRKILDFNRRYWVVRDMKKLGTLANHFPAF